MSEDRHQDPGLTWPVTAPAHGQVRLREFQDRDVDMVMDLATDPYIPLIGSLPAHATRAQALEYIERQRGRLAEGAGYAFCAASATDDIALGGVGLWLRALHLGRGSAGWAVAPAQRGQGVAAQAIIAMLSFAWTVAGLHRVEACIEPWNVASVRTAGAAGFQHEGTMRSHTPIGEGRADMELYAALRPSGDLPSGARP